MISGAAFGARAAHLARGWRGPAAAAALALAAALPGALGLPPLDRDESRFAQASAQMLESGDLVTIHFQDQPRFKKPVGIYWLQAASVALLSEVEDRDIWAYRIPSLAGAMLAAAACVWGASAFLSPFLALLAGALLASSFMLSTEADIAATDAVLTGAVTLSLAALARIWRAAREGGPVGRREPIAFWAGLALAILVKGPIGPMVAGLALVALALSERKVRWMGRLAWGWGLIALAAVLLPWAMAITVATDGAFWGAAIGGDLAPKLAEGQEGHGAPPGFYLLLLPLLIFPGSQLLPAAAVGAWRGRAEPLAWIALCWLIPAWLVFEATPTKLVHYTLPLYGAVCWLLAWSAGRAPSRPLRLGGAALSLAAGAVLAGLALAALPLAQGYRWGEAFGVVAALLFLAAGALPLAGLDRDPAASAFASVLVAVLAHAVLLGLYVPALQGLWISDHAADVLESAGLSPLEGAPGPVAVVGYAEPSLVFRLGADTELADPAAGVRAIAQGRPAIVEGRQQGAFSTALAQAGLRATLVGEAAGLDYSKGRHDILRIWRPAPPPEPPARNRRKAGSRRQGLDVTAREAPA